MRHLALWIVILLTWTSTDPDLLVYIEKRRLPAATFRIVAIVPGQYYLDSAKIREGETYCYRARYWEATTWTPEVCAQAGSVVTLTPPAPVSP